MIKEINGVYSLAAIPSHTRLFLFIVFHWCTLFGVENSDNQTAIVSVKQKSYFQLPLPCT